MVKVTSCGHDSHHPKPCNIEYKQGLPEYLILLIKRDCWCCINGEKTNVKPNSVICFPPETYIHYGCDISGYNDDWIHFVIDETESDILQKIQPHLCRILSLRDFHRLSEYVKMMSAFFHTDSTYHEQIMDSFMRIFLYSLLDELEKPLGSSIPHGHYRAFSALRTRIYNNPADACTVRQLADSLCLSLPYFQHLYKQFFGCSCQQDIISARLEQAKYYLQNSEMNIREISDFCGYHNELHFMRQFKKFIGETPSEYRKRR